MHSADTGLCPADTEFYYSVSHNSHPRREKANNAVTIGCAEIHSIFLPRENFHFASASMRIYSSPYSFTCLMIGRIF